MFDRLAQMEARYDSLSRDMSDPTLVSDQKRFQAIAKEHRDMEPVVEKYRQYRKLADGVAEAKSMLTDPDMKDMAQEELATLEPQLEPIAEALKVMLLPKDPNDDKNIVIELRAGTGGDEAALFVAEMFRIYLRFAEQHRWKVEVMSESESGIGNGLKDVTAIFEGDQVYQQMKYESGVHRVQRVPATETQGRVHTSAITVAVLPEAEEVDVKIEAERPPHRHLLLLRPRRPVGQHHLLRHPHHAPAHQHRRQLPGREIADQEPRKSHARPPLPPLRGRSRARPPAPGQGPQGPGRHRRPLAKKSAPTTSPRTASPTTASASPTTSSPWSWKASSNPPSTPSSPTTSPKR